MPATPEHRLHADGASRRAEACARPRRAGEAPRRIVWSAAPGDAARPRLERLVADIYAEAYGARLTSFLPQLVGLEDDGGALLGVIGTRLGAAAEPMFLEQYLDEPVEHLIARRLDRPVARAAVAEVGNLASPHPGGGCWLMTTLASWLEARGLTWAVFTATRRLRRTFERIGVELVELGAADARRLATAGDDWGRYYATDPRIVVAALRDVCRAGRDAAAVRACCAPLWELAAAAGRSDATAGVAAA